MHPTAFVSILGEEDLSTEVELGPTKEALGSVQQLICSQIEFYSLTDILVFRIIYRSTCLDQIKEYIKYLLYFTA